MVEITEEDVNFLYRALVNFTNCCDHGVSLVDLMEGARKIATSLVPCTSSATNKYANSKVVASTVTRAYILKYTNSTSGIMTKKTEAYMERFEQVFKRVWIEKKKEEKKGSGS